MASSLAQTFIRLMVAKIMATLPNGKALGALALLTLSACSILEPGPTCSHAWSADTVGTTVIQHTAPCWGRFR